MEGLFVVDLEVDYHVENFLAQGLVVFFEQLRDLDLLLIVYEVAFWLLGLEVVGVLHLILVEVVEVLEEFWVAEALGLLNLFCGLGSVELLLGQVRVFCGVGADLLLLGLGLVFGVEFLVWWTFG